MNCSRKIPEKDLKKLWGRAAGRCSLCHDNVLPLIDNNVDVIGDMAHVIAYKKDGARGEDGSEYNNSYENLLLVCPTCHRIIDHNPLKYPSEVLFTKKQEWENTIESALEVTVQFETQTEAFRKIVALLEENHEIWLHSGPESKIAKINPASNMADYWTLRKLDTIVPNNRAIIKIGDSTVSRMPDNLLTLFCKFKEHAKMFEQGCYVRIDNPLRFPRGFEKEVRRYAAQ